MKREIMIVIFTLFFILSLSNNTLAERAVRIRLSDGTEISGLIVSEDGECIEIKNKSGIIIKIPKSQIVSESEYSVVIKYTEDENYDPNGMRLFFAPTARPLKSWGKFISVMEIFLPTIGIGITDYSILAGGMSLVPGAEQQYIYMHLKFIPFQQENLNLAFGNVYATLTEGERDWDGGFLYTVLTAGDYNYALTLGGGLLWDNKTYPAIFLGGETRVSRSIKLISENWELIEHKLTIVSLGVRFIGRYLSSDLALVYGFGPNTNSAEGFPFIPWVSFTYNF